VVWPFFASRFARDFIESSQPTPQRAILTNNAPPSILNATGLLDMESNGYLTPFVTLVSSDGFEFHVRRSAACVSGTIRRMLDPQSKSPLPPLSTKSNLNALQATSSKPGPASAASRT
jgi:hypothetical protein